MFQCIKALLYQSEVIDINAANESGDTVLHLAAKWSYGKILVTLLVLAFWPSFILPKLFLDNNISI